MLWVHSREEESEFHRFFMPCLSLRSPIQQRRIVRLRKHRKETNQTIAWWFFFATITSRWKQSHGNLSLQIMPGQETRKIPHLTALTQWPSFSPRYKSGRIYSLPIVPMFLCQNKSDTYFLIQQRRESPNKKKIKGEREKQLTRSLCFYGSTSDSAVGWVFNRRTRTRVRNCHRAGCLTLELSRWLLLTSLCRLLGAPPGKLSLLPLLWTSIDVKISKDTGWKVSQLRCCFYFLHNHNVATPACMQGFFRAVSGSSLRICVPVRMRLLARLPETLLTKSCNCVHTQLNNAWEHTKSGLLLVLEGNHNVSVLSRAAVFKQRSVLSYVRAWATASLSASQALRGICGCQARISAFVETYFGR